MQFKTNFHRSSSFASALQSFGLWFAALYWSTGRALKRDVGGNTQKVVYGNVSKIYLTACLGEETAVSEKRLHWNSFLTPSMARMRSCYEAAGDKIGVLVEEKKNWESRIFISINSHVLYASGSFSRLSKVVVDVQAIYHSSIQWSRVELEHLRCSQGSVCDSSINSMHSY